MKHRNIVRAAARCVARQDSHPKNNNGDFRLPGSLNAHKRTGERAVGYDRSSVRDRSRRAVGSRGGHQ